MKLKLIIPFFLVISVCISAESYSQTDGVEKDEILSAMNSFEGLGLGTDKEGRLKEANQRAVDRVFDIARSSDSEEEKMNKFKNAREENEKLFKDILGDNEFEKYKKSMKKKLRPFKRRAKLVGFLL